MTIRKPMAPEHVQFIRIPPLAEHVHTVGVVPVVGVPMVTTRGIPRIHRITRTRRTG